MTLEEIFKEYEQLQELMNDVIANHFCFHFLVETNAPMPYIEEAATAMQRLKTALSDLNTQFFEGSTSSPTIALMANRLERDQVFLQELIKKTGL